MKEIISEELYGCLITASNDLESAVGDLASQPNEKVSLGCKTRARDVLARVAALRQYIEEHTVVERDRPAGGS